MRVVLHPEILIRGNYEATIKAWEQHYPSGQILYLFHDDIEVNQREQLQGVCRFLGVDAGKLPPASQDGQRVNVAPEQDMPQFVRDALLQHYRSDIAFLEKKFDRDLSQWVD